MWAPGPVWTGAENLVHTGIRSPDRPGSSVGIATELPGPHTHTHTHTHTHIYIYIGKDKRKGEIHPITVYEGPDGE